MKMLDIEYELDRKINLANMIQCIENIHKDVAWKVESNHNTLLGYVKEDVWLYEYMLNYETYQKIRFCVSKISDLSPTTICNLQFLEEVEKLEDGEIDDLELFDLFYLKEVIQDCYEMIESNSQQYLDLMIPILRVGSEENLYEYEIHDMLISILEDRKDVLTKMNSTSYELYLINQILQYNSYKGEREEYLKKLQEVLIKEKEKKLYLLTTSGIRGYKGEHYYFTFYDDPRYDAVFSATTKPKVLYHQLIHKFF